MDLEAEIDRLYGAPLDEFIGERDALAKQLNRDGDREGGTRVKALRKPTVGAWALNQAIRRRRSETKSLLAVAERLRAAQEALLAGGDAGELRDATREERSLTSTLADSAEAIASEAGKSGPALRDRVRATLHAAALDDGARAELEAGRFTREREAVGLGALELGTPAAPSRAPARKPAARKREGAGAKPARPPSKRSSGTRPAAPDPRLAEAESELSEARQAHEAAVSEHSAAAATLSSARDALREAEVAEREARRVAREHEREVAKRERKLERLRPKQG